MRLVMSLLLSFWKKKNLRARVLECMSLSAWALGGAGIECLVLGNLGTRGAHASMLECLGARYAGRSVTRMTS